MSFPDLTNQEDPFQAVEQQSNNEINPQGDFSPFQDNQNMQTANVIEPQVDEEEIKRQEQRMAEENERRQKIAAKQEMEMKMKNERREEAMKFINEFEQKRQEEITKRKQINIKNEEDNLANRKLIKEGKKNPWENVVENITVKESEYKGSKDVSRMRNVILAHKNDKLNDNQINFFLICKRLQYFCKRFQTYVCV